MYEDEIGPDDVLLLIKQGEGELIEWKDSRILTSPAKLARSMVAMANHKGGLILIGVKDDGTIEGMEYKKGHEEYIMNVATEKCSPPVRPKFRRVTIPNQGSVYVIKIVRKENEVRHGVKTKDGLVYPIRVGSTIREMSPLELSGSPTKGVKIKPYTPEEKGFLFITEGLVSFISRKRNWSLVKTMLVLVATGILLISVSMLFLFGGSYGVPGFPLTYPWWGYIFILVGLVVGIYFCFSIPTIMKDTNCPACKAVFQYKKKRSEVLNKRRKSKELEEWTVRNFYHCDACGYENEVDEFEEHDI
jgi:hypothetical protein